MSAMFYYHNPLSFAGGATRLPSLELPFSPAQPCESSSEKVVLIVFVKYSFLL